MIKIIALTTVETGSLLALAKEKLGRSIAIDVDAAKRDIKTIPSVISCLKHFSGANPDLSVWDHTMEHITMSVIVSVEEPSSLWLLLKHGPFNHLLSENKTIAVFTGTLLQWLFFSTSKLDLDIEIQKMSNEIYQQLIFGGFGPFFKDFRQVMKNGYFLLEKA